MGVTQFFSNKQHTYFFFLKMPEFKDMMASGKNGWTSWWAFNFWIAQAFHLMYINGFSSWITADAESKAMMAFNIFAFLAFFMVPIAHFITGCQMTKKICMVIGVCAYLISISIFTGAGGSFVTGYWFFGVGWAGWVNGLISAIYMFLHKSEDEKEDDALSSVLICVTFSLAFIANMGFSVWEASWTAYANFPVVKAALVFDILGTAFAGFSALCCWYKCKKGKMGCAIAAALFLFLSAAMF